MTALDPQENRRARQQALDAATADLRQSVWCLAAVVSGSVAVGTADPWSDIDMRIVVDPDAYDAVKARKYEIPRRWADVLFDEEVPRDNLAIVHCRPFFKMDVFYFRPADLAASPYWLLPQLVLHDPHGVVAGVIESSRGMPIDAGRRSLRFLQTRAVAAAEEVRRKLLRHEPIPTHCYLDELRGWIIQVHQRKAGADSRQDPFRYAEHGAPADFREAILHSCRGGSFEGLEAALQDLGALLMGLLDEGDGDLRRALCCALGASTARKS